MPVSYGKFLAGKQATCWGWGIVLFRSFTEKQIPHPQTTRVRDDISYFTSWVVLLVADVDWGAGAIERKDLQLPLDRD
jgi:hypothetical protein